MAPLFPGENSTEPDGWSLGVDAMRQKVGSGGGGVKTAEGSAFRFADHSGMTRRAGEHGNDQLPSPPQSERMVIVTAPAGRPPWP